MKISLPNILRSAILTAAAVVCTFTMQAFDLSTYAESSLLADGNWVKVSVPESGVYCITNQQLSQWGFKDPARVRVYGYGGTRIPNQLTADNYVDDLPLVQSVTTKQGVVFYGAGPGVWTEYSSAYHLTNNVYTNCGYYFVTESDVTPREIASQGVGQVSNPANSFYDRIHYELDQTSPGESGYILVGENFKHQNNRKFNFSTPGLIPDNDTYLEATFVCKSYTASAADIYINGEQLGSVTLPAVTNSGYIHGDYVQNVNKFKAKASSLMEVKINVRNINATQNVWLDYIAINYMRRLEMPDEGCLNFWSASPELSLDKGDGAVVWDVTDPNNVTRLNTAANGQALTWGNDYSGMRSYVAWTEQSSLPAPKYEGTVMHQNIHGMDNAEMIIFTLPEFKAQAERIAQLHTISPKPLRVAVLNVDEVYNEFGSGMADVSALRKCLKMFYDRAPVDSIKLRYVLLLGRSTYDNRHLTAKFQGSNSYNTIPYYIGGNAKIQLSDNTAYGTDDFIAMLEDNSGSNLGLDNLCVAVGRIPATSVSEARNAVDKLYQYVRECETGTWKNSFLFLADDGDNGIHAQQTEDMIGCLINTPGQQNFINKVYVDAYNLVGGTCVTGRNEMFRLLNEGVVWWNYSGHANNHSWTGEGMLTYSDINKMYLKKVPVLLAATCDFLRWDSNTISGGELLFNERNGGVISAISATRPVYISENGLFTKAVGRSISLRDSVGQLPRLGDIYRTAKNNIINDNGDRRSNPNRLRYVLMGDPAMMLPTPSNLIKVESIGGQALTPEAQITLMALQQTEITGVITSPTGEVLEDFDGKIQINIYDAERSTSTKGDRAENIVLTFEQHGDILFSGLGTVTGGHFTLKVSMPGEVSDNFRPALMNMYAYTNDKSAEAIGINSDFYVYGYDESVAPDNVPPVIQSMALNHTSFADGDVVNDTPMLLADISDDIGINLSAAGIGHQMVLTLDGKTNFTDVSLYYTPTNDGSAAGTITYPLPSIGVGEHTLSLKIWDTASNSATRQISFKVEQGVTPTIFNVYTDVNPASTEVKFYVNHNRPDAELQITIEVFDLLGHPLWETTANGISNMFVSSPVTWDLCDHSGRRLPRGIYLYRATISTDQGETYASEARRLAITAY